MPTLRPTLLVDLEVDDVSAVNDPANMRPGWLALKAARPRVAPVAAVIAKAEAQRITSGVVYEPLPAIDAHGEGVEPEQLSLSFLTYATKGSKTLSLQHQPNTDVGQVVALICWPVAASATFCLDTCKSQRLEPGTVLGITRWTPAAWPAVRDGRIGGYSLSGRAVRVPPRTRPQ